MARRIEAPRPHRSPARGYSYNRAIKPRAKYPIAFANRAYDMGTGSADWV
jgi:hypothetical protein